MDPKEAVNVVVALIVIAGVVSIVWAIHDEIKGRHHPGSYSSHNYTPSTGSSHHKVYTTVDGPLGNKVQDDERKSDCSEENQIESRAFLLLVFFHLFSFKRSRATIADMVIAVFVGMWDDSSAAIAEFAFRHHDFGFILLAFF